MSTTANFVNSVGALFDLTPKVYRFKKKRFSADLVYELNNDDVVTAWADTALLIARSYNSIVKDEKFGNKLRVCEVRIGSDKNRINMNALKNISVDEICKLLDESYSPHKQFCANKTDAELKLYNELK